MGVARVGMEPRLAQFIGHESFLVGHNKSRSKLFMYCATLTVTPNVAEISGDNSVAMWFHRQGMSLRVQDVDGQEGHVQGD